jgi:hypothetical protein
MRRQGETPRSPADLTDEEEAVMDHILAAYRGIESLGLKANHSELVHAVHTLQGFVGHHVLQRLGGPWATWFEL